jgi:hypothetical protein
MSLSQFAMRVPTSPWDAQSLKLVPFSEEKEAFWERNSKQVERESVLLYCLCSGVGSHIVVSVVIVVGIYLFFRVMAHVERCSGSGTLNLKMRGIAVTETTEAVETPLATSYKEDIDDEIVVYASDDIVIAPDEVDGPPDFVDYVSGGCRLHVITAIDYTASNGKKFSVGTLPRPITCSLSLSHVASLYLTHVGDPRKEESLHHFKKDGMNEYETAISKICTILSEYDDDKKYPVWGFGAKKDGTLHNCFQCGLEEEVAGVEGILGAYKQAFKSGVVMSKPTDITQVIRAAGEESRKCLVSEMAALNKANALV